MRLLVLVLLKYVISSLVAADLVLEGFFLLIYVNCLSWLHSLWSLPSLVFHTRLGDCRHPHPDHRIVPLISSPSFLEAADLSLPREICRSLS